MPETTETTTSTHDAEFEAGKRRAQEVRAKRGKRKPLTEAAILMQKAAEASNPPETEQTLRLENEGKQEAQQPSEPESEVGQEAAPTPPAESEEPQAEGAPPSPATPSEDPMASAMAELRAEIAELRKEREETRTAPSAPVAPTPPPAPPGVESYRAAIGKVREAREYDPQLAPILEDAFKAIDERFEHLHGQYQQMSMEAQAVNAAEQIRVNIDDLVGDQDWRKEVAADEFDTWVDSHPKGIANAIRETQDPEECAYHIRNYRRSVEAKKTPAKAPAKPKAPTPPTPSVQARREAQLEGAMAVQQSGMGAPMSHEEDEPDKGSFEWGRRQAQKARERKARERRSSGQLFGPASSARVH